MIISSLIVKINVPFVHSLKEKRSIIKRITSKVRSKFNVSISEIDEQDTHQRIIIGIATVTNSVSYSDMLMDQIINYIESITEGNIYEVNRELR